MDKEIKSLSNSPLFNLSLASKELFHSNFIAWAIEDNKDLTKLFFESLLKIELGYVKKVNREQRNIDLTIDFGNVRVLIENKVKSVPDLHQLEKYKVNLGDNEKLILLSLFGSDEIEGVKVVSYKEFLAFIYSCKENASSKYLEGIYDDYINFIESLLRLTSRWEIMDSFDFHSFFEIENEKNSYLQLFEVRLHDLYHKLKYNKLKLLIFEKLYSNLDKSYQKNLHHFDYFSNGTGAASLWYVLDKDENGEIKKRLEMQIQNNWLRLMVISKGIEKKKHTLLNNPIFMELFEFFEMSPIESITGKVIYPKNGGFNKYGKDLIYRNKKIEENSIEKLVTNSSLFFKEVIKFAECHKESLVEILE